MRNAQVLFLASLGAAVAATLAIAQGGCGSNNSTTGPSNSGSSSGGVSSSSSSGSSSGTTSSSSSGSGGSSSSGTGTVIPGLCPTDCPTGQLCCAQRTGATPDTSCAASTDCPDSGTVQCLSKSDCPMGQTCCGPSGSSQPLGTQCMAQCAASGYLSRIVCGSVLDCPDSTYTCPTNKATDSTAGLYKTCHPPVADAGTAAADAASE